MSGLLNWRSSSSRSVGGGVSSSTVFVEPAGDLLVGQAVLTGAELLLESSEVEQVPAARPAGAG